MIKITTTGEDWGYVVQELLHREQEGHDPRSVPAGFAWHPGRLPKDYHESSENFQLQFTPQEVEFLRPVIQVTLGITLEKK